MKNNPYPIFSFSLLEALVVIGVISFIAGMIIFGTANFLPNIRLRGETKGIISDLRQAQELAVTEQIPHKVLFNPGNSTYQLIRVSNTGEEILEDHPLSSQITLETTLLNNEVSFGSDGAPSNSGQITLKNPKNQTKIYISPAGLIKEI